MDFVSNVQLKKSLLTKNELKACEAIMGDLAQAQKLSLTEMSENIQITKATILRFVQKLGYSGYTEFRYDLIRYANSIHEKEDSEQCNPIEMLANAYADAIRLLVETLSEESMRALAQLIKEAGYVYLAGEVNSEVSALQMKYILLMLGIKASVLNSESALKTIDLSAKKEDLIIAYTVSGKSGTAKKAKEICESNGCRLVLVTMDASLKGSGEYDEVIVLPSLSVTKRSMHENVPMYSVFNEVVLYYLGQEK